MCNFFFFFFNDTATTEIYTLSLHDALPICPEAQASPALPTAPVVELSFPNRLEVIDAVLSAYQSDLRRPATSIFVLDVSGSMKGARLAQMKEALKLLSGAEASADRKSVV